MDTAAESIGGLMDNEKKILSSNKMKGSEMKTSTCTIYNYNNIIHNTFIHKCS